MSNKAKWGYLAGIMDGEGTFAVHKGSKPAPNGNGYMTAAPRYNFSISVANTDERLMKWLVKNFGGSWSWDKKRLNEKWKRRCVWRSCGMRNKEIILLAILPYLVMKREQALVGLAFIRLYGESNPQKREELYQAMKKLNRRGVLVTTNTDERSLSDGKKSMGWRWKPDEVEPELERMIESDLIRNNESAPGVIQVA